MAPELFEDKPPSPAADLWSLGATLFHAVKGTGPFDRTSTAATLHAILHDDLPPMDEYPLLAPLISGLLTRDSSRRMTSRQAAALLETAGTATPPSPGHQAGASGPEPNRAGAGGDTSGATWEAHPTTVRPAAAVPTPERDESRFHGGRRAVRTRLRKEFSRAFAIFMVFCSAPSVLFAVVNHDAGWLWGIPLCTALAMVMFGLIGGAIIGLSPKDVELLIDRTGITVNWGSSPARGTGQWTVTWEDVVCVGVLQPKPGTVNPKRTELYEANHLLVVGLQPNAPHPSPVDVLSDQLHQLGYLALGKIEGFGATKEQLLAALDRFAGERVVHGRDELLERDPRLHPGML